jgi:His/Glu/Gln/Arg/opine family amino acid ABC transporter permease subunit
MAVDTRICREARAESACWALITERYRFILFGTYPYAEQWRGAVVIVLFLALYGVSAMRQFWNIKLVGIWAAGLDGDRRVHVGRLCRPHLCRAGEMGRAAAYAHPRDLRHRVRLSAVDPGGARRRSSMPAIRYICVAYIELIRGVPLISVLFMASVMFPLFLPEGITIDKLLRAQVAIIMFTAAYLAEVVRGGLQAIPKGQYEAADALGLGYWKKTGLIVLPQALRILHPAHGRIVHRSVQGHLARHHHRPVRPARGRQGVDRRAALGRVRRRGVHLHLDHLLRVLLRDVEVQPESRGPSSPGTPSAEDHAYGIHRSRRADRDRHRRRDAQRQQVVRRVPRAARHQPHRPARARRS